MYHKLPEFLILFVLTSFGIGSQIHYSADKVSFSAMIIAQSELRGPAAAAVYSETELAAFYNHFQATVTETVTASQERQLYVFTQPDSFELGATFTELGNGALSLSVTAKGEYGASLKTWDSTYGNPDTFKQDLEAFAEKVATDLATL